MCIFSRMQKWREYLRMNIKEVRKIVEQNRRYYFAMLKVGIFLIAKCEWARRRVARRREIFRKHGIRGN
jgi:hypothetical protein